MLVQEEENVFVREMLKAGERLNNEDVFDVERDTVVLKRTYGQIIVEISHGKQKSILSLDFSRKSCCATCNTNFVYVKRFFEDFEQKLDEINTQCQITLCETTDEQNISVGVIYKTIQHVLKEIIVVNYSGKIQRKGFGKELIVGLQTITCAFPQIEEYAIVFNDDGSFLHINDFTTKEGYAATGCVLVCDENIYITCNSFTTKQFQPIQTYFCASK